MDPTSAQSLIAAAMNALKSGDRSTARRYAVKAAALAPQTEEPWLILAYLASPRAAQYYLRRVLQANPSNQRAKAGLEWYNKQALQSQPPTQVKFPAAPVTRVRTPPASQSIVNAVPLQPPQVSIPGRMIPQAVAWMIQFSFKKLLRVSIVLIGTMLITFLLIRAIPGNPWNNYASSPRALQGIGYDQPTLTVLDRRFGLDLPLWRQFTRYLIGDISEDGSFMCGVVCGNLGPSLLRRGRTVQSVLFDPPEGKTSSDSLFGYSVRLVLFGALIAVGIGIPLGILSARKTKSTLSRAISVGIATLVSIPNFVLGLLAVIFLASQLGIIQVLPNWENPGHWIVPALVLAVVPMANIARVTREALMNILGEDYVRTARAKGLTEARVVLVHVTRNALAPILTYSGPVIMEMFVGLFIVENMFSFPGIGRGFWEAVLQLDYPMIMGLTLIYATGIMVITLLTEVICAILDPRLRATEQRGMLL